MEDILKVYLASTGVRQYKYFPTIGSTNDEALSWITNGAEDFSLVIADEQTSGRGRFQRRWITNPGSSLAFTLIVRPLDVESQRISFFSPLCGIAVREAVEKTLALEPQIKWPNDVLLNRRKFCGILVEASWLGGKASGIVMGIGVNITPDSIPPTENQQYPATCLENEALTKIDRFLILQNILLSIEKWRGKLATPEFMQEWQEHLAFIGESVRIEHSEKASIIGKMKGINTEGNLVLILEDGREMNFEIGDVHLRPGISTDSGG